MEKIIENNANIGKRYLKIKKISDLTFLTLFSTGFFLWKSGKTDGKRGYLRNFSTVR